jgi:hypothetical protein
MFCFAALADLNTSTMYTNLPGSFPFRSFKSMQYIFFAYIYDLDGILVHAMPSNRGGTDKITKNNLVILLFFQ